jgi:hypothetical protein
MFNRSIRPPTTVKLNAVTGLPEKPFLMKVTEGVGALSRSAAYAVSYGAGLGIALADLFFGPQLGFARVYLFPIGLITWSQGRRAGVTLAVLSSILWTVSDFYGFPSLSPWVGTWNAVVRFGFLLTGALML